MSRVRLTFVYMNELVDILGGGIRGEALVDEGGKKGRKEEIARYLGIGWRGNGRSCDLEMELRKCHS